MPSDATKSCDDTMWLRSVAVRPPEMLDVQAQGQVFTLHGEGEISTALLGMILGDRAPTITADLVVAVQAWFDHLPPVVSDAEVVARFERLHEFLCEVDGLADVPA